MGTMKNLFVDLASEHERRQARWGPEKNKVHSHKGDFVG